MRNRVSEVVSLVLLLVAPGACGDDGGSDGSGVASADASMSSSAGTDSTQSTSTGADASESTTGSETGGADPCAGAMCRDGCTPATCPRDDCSAYACDERGQCRPYDDIVCADSIAACDGLACGAECIDPYCDPEDGGMCAPSFCNGLGVCVPIAQVELNPCMGATESGGSESGSSGTG